MATQLARITRATFGYGGYQGVMFGLTLDFGWQGGGVGDFKGSWAPSQINRDEAHTKWTEEERREAILEAALLLDATLKKAKKEHVAELEGTPVELTFDSTGGCLESWRVLEEVL